MLTRINTDYVAGNSIHWGIADKLSQKIIGTCGYYRGFDDGVGEFGCVLLRQHRGQGYMTSALLLAIGFGLNHMGLKRIRAVTSQRNTDAIKLLERVNFMRIADLKNDDVEYELRLPL